MRRLLVIFVLASFAFISRAQQVVIDPSQIAASATNAAEQVDYMLDQLGELANLGDQLSSVRGYIDEVFGDDGVGGKTISVLQDLGTLERLTESYMNTIKRTEQLAKRIQEMEEFHLSDANMMLTYLRSMKNQAELAIETAKSILSTLGFSRSEKKKEIEDIIDEMENDLKKMSDMVEIEAEATVIAAGLTDFVDFLDGSLEPDNYTEALEAYGSLDDAGEGGLGIISMILGLMTLLSTAWGYLIFTRGSIANDPVADNVMFRIAAGCLAGLLALRIIGGVMGYNL